MSTTSRLRMARHSPTPQDRTAPTAISSPEAGPSRLPDVSQLLNVTLNDMDVSDDNIYASDVPTEPNAHPQPNMATPPPVTRADNPAAVLRALLSRLPNSNETYPANEGDQRHHPSNEEFDDEDETASATTSVAQSNVKNIFSRALREPGDTPTKDRSRRRRSSSIGATDAEDTPHILEARDIKGMRRSLSDDEVENGNKSVSRPRSHLRATPQPLTKEFLRQRFEKSDSTNLPSLSQHMPPMATSTPQHSLRMSVDYSKFKSNLLEPDAAMQDVFDALGSSTDNMSDRSSSPAPTLEIEPVDNDDLPTNGVFGTSRVHHSQPSFDVTPKPGSKELPSVTRNLRSSTEYESHDFLGEQTMSLSLPAGHTAPKRGTSTAHSKSPSPGKLSHSRSSSFNRPSSPLPGHQRPHTPVDSIHERERHWNKPRHVRHDSLSSSHLPRPSSALSLRSTSPSPSHHHGHDRPLLHERERNWNSPHPSWHDRSPSPLLARGKKQDSSSFTNGNSNQHPPTPVNRKLKGAPKSADSPPMRLPDLPTPSSDDSSRSPVTKIPKLDTTHQNKWPHTPKPPGGWYHAPTVPVRDETILDASNLVTSSDDKENQTPVTQQVKTPKLAGWCTPGPVELKPDKFDTQQDEDGQRTQLLTPVNSISKSAVSHLKTPGVPGGWLATPTARKSVLKVRFDPGSPLVQRESASRPNLPEFSPASDILEPSQVGDQESGAPPSPHSPRRLKATIRVLDAFGREETPASPNRDATRNRTDIRMLDTMGREHDPNESKEGDSVSLSRDELMSNLRQGLEDLSEGLNDRNERADILDPDRSRIRELVSTSRQAKSARRRLQSQSERSVIRHTFSKPPFISLNWKTWFALLLLQTVVFLVLYRVSVERARTLFFNAYYDAFDPELHSHVFKSDYSLHLPWLESSSSTWSRTLLPDGWSSMFDFTNIQSYISQPWPVGIQRYIAWTPT